MDCIWLIKCNIAIFRPNSAKYPEIEEAAHVNDKGWKWQNRMILALKQNELEFLKHIVKVSNIII